MRYITLALFVHLAGFACAHQDPWGEIHPRVTANSDGSFTITFRYSDPHRQGWMRLMVGSDGRGLVPRHWIPAAEEGADGRPAKGHTKDGPALSMVSTSADSERLVLMEPAGLPPAAGETIRVLPFETGAAGFPLGMTAAGNEIAVTVGDPVAGKEEGLPLSLWVCRRDNFQTTHKVPLGKAACIYDFPSATHPLWAAGRWWVAWVQPRRAGETDTWTTVLSSVDPDSGKVEHRDLPGLSNWNTDLTMAVNASGTICVAWHASQDGTYPGTAKIVTAVFTPLK